MANAVAVRFGSRAALTLGLVVQAAAVLASVPRFRVTTDAAASRERIGEDR